MDDPIRIPYSGYNGCVLTVYYTVTETSAHTAARFLLFDVPLGLAGMRAIHVNMWCPGSFLYGILGSPSRVFLGIFAEHDATDQSVRRHSSVC
jgi:hypothetical protein